MKSKFKKFNRKFNLPMFKTIGNTEYKLCSKCGIYKEYAKFSKSNLNKSGLKSACKSCCSVTYNNPNYYVDKHFNSNNELKCFKCNEYKSVEEFNIDNTKTIRGNRSIYCKECEAKRKYLSRRTSNPKSDLNLHLKGLLRGCKNRINGNTRRGKYKNKEFNIDLLYLEELLKSQNYVCAISGIKMTYNIGFGKQKYNISIDRLNNNEGYIKGNIQLVCSHVNIMRGNLDIKDLIELCNIITLYNENRN